MLLIYIYKCAYIYTVLRDLRGLCHIIWTGGSICPFTAFFSIEEKKNSFYTVL